MPRIAMTLAFVVAASGCGSVPERVPVAGAEPAQVVVVYLPQQELDADSPDSGAGMGFLGSISYSKANVRLVAIMREIQQAVQQFDFEARLVLSLREGLPATLVQQGANLVVVRTAAELTRVVRNAYPGNVLALRVRYAFGWGLQGLYVRIHAFFGPANSASATVDSTLAFQQSGNYISEHVGHAVSLAQEFDYQYNSKVWAKDGSRRTKEALQLGIDELVPLLADDLANVVQGEGPPVAFVTETSPVSPRRKGSIVVERGNRLLVTSNWRTLHWIDREQLRQVPAW